MQLQMLCRTQLEFTQRKTRIMNSEQLKSGLRVIQAIAETIREAGEVPSGVIYAALMDKMSLSDFTKVIDILKNAGLIEEKAHMLKWICTENS